MMEDVVIKISDEQRSRVYELTLDSLNAAIKRGSGVGLRYYMQEALMAVTGLPEEEVTYVHVHATFPEIFKAFASPDAHICGHWWPTDKEGLKKRRDILLTVMARHTLSWLGLGKPTASFRMPPFNGYNAPPRD